jgi:hypothetical protein
VAQEFGFGNRFDQIEVVIINAGSDATSGVLRRSERTKEMPSILGMLISTIAKS